MKEKYVKFRHRVYFKLVRPIAWILARKYHFKTKPRKLKKGEQYLILANHQGLLDPVFVALSFKAPVYFMAADSLFSKKLHSRLLVHCFAPIKKSKGLADFSSIRTMRQIAKEGGNVALFPEGNRAWCDRQFYIDKSVCKLVRMLGLPLLLYNFHGGYGVNPRWSDAVRKGKFVGEVKKILSVEQIAKMDNEQLYNEIVSSLKVIDSDSGQLFKSKRKAEFLERELFVCPKCHSFSSLRSHGNSVTCARCGLEVFYGENLRLSSTDNDFPFERLSDWYGFQQEFVKGFPLPERGVIFEDDDVRLFDKSTPKHRLVAKGKMTLDKENLRVGEFSVPLCEIENCSAVGGVKMDLNTTSKHYFVVGHERFNVIKYLLFFNVLCKNIVEKGGDKYYGLSVDNGNC